MEKTIIGISGRKQSGKTSLANYIQAKYTIGHMYPNAVIMQKQEHSGTITYLEEPSSNEERIFCPKECCFNDNKLLKYDRKVLVCSFADSLKKICIDVLGLTYEQCNGTDEQKNQLTQYYWDNIPETVVYPEEGFGPIKEGLMTARELMQLTGTNIMRNMFGRDIWVNATLRKIEKLDAHIVLVPDVRFKSEVEALANIDNSYVIRLERSICSDSHISETELDGYDFEQHGDKVLVIDNRDHTMMKTNEIIDKFLMEKNL